ncbi:NAD(P)H-dependent oxidoreductase [Vibrio zhugei]|uniref:NAD(P)H-dependent oxidoreductase n=1 Tax=Vibrio zhugei TaxID=2479546 RepID=A0ABV7CB38_9VIBR|nr:NAD(P)H-dependent oxidoreductase [Vibrio zhugei]
MKKVLVINANPKKNSFCGALSGYYVQAAIDKHEVKQIHLSDMHFETSLDAGYETETALEPDLVRFQELITWSEHIVIITPVWWGSVPAKFKGLVDRVFLPNFAFRYVKGKAMPDKLLVGRSAEIIVTLDTPPLWYKYIQGNIIYKQLKIAILDFAGIKNRKTTYLGPIIGSTVQKRKEWLDKVSALAKQI